MTVFLSITWVVVLVAAYLVAVRILQKQSLY